VGITTYSHLLVVFGITGYTLWYEGRQKGEKMMGRKGKERKGGL